MNIYDPHYPRFPRLRYIFIYVRSMLAMRGVIREVYNDLQLLLDPTNIEHVAVWNMAVLEVAYIVADIENQRERNGKMPMSYIHNKRVIRAHLGPIVIAQLADLNQ